MKRVIINSLASKRCLLKCVAVFLCHRVTKITISATLAMKCNVDVETHVLFHVSNVMAVISKYLFPIIFPFISVFVDVPFILFSLLSLF
jgi:hypothetical protein